MSWVSAAAAVAGAAVAVYGAVRQGDVAKKTGEYNAQIAERDAVIATQKAEYDAESSSQKFKILMGKQRALYAKAGVDMTSGSPLLVMSFQAEQAERDRQAILLAGKTAAESDSSRAGLFRMTGESAQTAGYITGGSTFLTSLADVTRKSRYDTKYNIG